MAPFPNEGLFSDPQMKLLLFTEHKDTLDFLVADGKDGRPLGKLREWGLTVTQIHGGMKIGDQRVLRLRSPIKCARACMADSLWLRVATLQPRSSSMTARNFRTALVFKRLKTLAHLGHVPKHDERSSRA